MAESYAPSRFLQIGVFGFGWYPDSALEEQHEVVFSTLSNARCKYGSTFLKKKSLKKPSYLLPGPKNPLRLVVGCCLILATRVLGFKLPSVCCHHKFIVVRSLLYYYRPLDRFVVVLPDETLNVHPCSVSCCCRQERACAFLG